VAMGGPFGGTCGWFVGGLANGVPVCSFQVWSMLSYRGRKSCGAARAGRSGGSEQGESAGAPRERRWRNPPLLWPPRALRAPPTPPPPIPANQMFFQENLRWSRRARVVFVAIKVGGAAGLGLAMQSLACHVLPPHEDLRRVFVQNHGIPGSRVASHGPRPDHRAPATAGTTGHDKKKKNTNHNNHRRPSHNQPVPEPPNRSTGASCLIRPEGGRTGCNTRRACRDSGAQGVFGCQTADLHSAPVGRFDEGARPRWDRKQARTRAAGGRRTTGCSCFFRHVRGDERPLASCEAVWRSGG